MISDLKKIFNHIAIIFIIITLYSCSNKKAGEIIVTIQPFDNVSSKTCKMLKSNIEDYYGFKVYIIKKKNIPKAFFTKVKSPRYRADSTIKYLKNIKPDSVDFVLGVTTKDISSTIRDPWGNIKKPKYKYGNWGIFGLGYRPGPSCIISSFRLGKGDKLKNRLQKIALHELGHNLGLKHCPNKVCFMRDAAEKLNTIDEVKLNLCSACKSKI